MHPLFFGANPAKVLEAEKKDIQDQKEKNQAAAEEAESTEAVGA